MSGPIEAIRIYESWLADALIDQMTKDELQAIADNPKEIEDRFYRHLEFGTGGIRGVIGAGTNRMNLYTVGKATQGLAQYILQQSNAGHSEQTGESGQTGQLGQSEQTGPSEQTGHSEQTGQAASSPSQHSVVIAYDPRHQSPEFALEAALVLAGNGIRAYIFDALRPTPELSFAVRELKASAGIVITASHNPPEYNGYKVYGSDGGQLVTEAAHKVTEQIHQLDSFSQVKKISREEAKAQQLLEWIGESIDQSFIKAITSLSMNTHAVNQQVKVVYTPLHGAGNKLVRTALREIGCTQVHIVKEQEQPDANFSTVESPNPEEQEAFALATKVAEEVDADIVIGTDPDCDRMGAVVRNHNGQFTVLTGNQTGALLTYYLLSMMKDRGTLPANGVILKTIVTSELGAKIAESFGIKVLNTLTGFKYIGEKMTEFEATKANQFIFGYEESYGYLAGTHCRDKDAVVSSMLICEAAAYYKKQGKTIYDVLQEIYQTYGYFLENLKSITRKGKAGSEQIQQTMSYFRTLSDNPKFMLEFMGVGLSEVKDYMQGIEDLPEENVLKYILKDGSWFCLRPSGTEPKLKIYFGVDGTSTDDARNRLEHLVEQVMSLLKK